MVVEYFGKLVVGKMMRGEKDVFFVVGVMDGVVRLMGGGCCF